MRNLVLGVLAHVDAGKTTLSEALLYTSGAIRTLGRVDHRDAHLDTDAIERERGITIFSKQARFSLPDGSAVTLLDTPGHVDFSAEMERTLQVLDAAVLVISGTDGVQAHTETLWRLLKRYRVPTLIFVTKMDLSLKPRDALMRELEKLDGACVDFSDEAIRMEQAAMLDESALEAYLAEGSLADALPCLVRLGAEARGCGGFSAGSCALCAAEGILGRFRRAGLSDPARRAGHASDLSEGDGRSAARARRHHLHAEGRGRIRHGEGHCPAALLRREI